MKEYGLVGQIPGMLLGLTIGSLAAFSTQEAKIEAVQARLDSQLDQGSMLRPVPLPDIPKEAGAPPPPPPPVENLIPDEPLLEDLNADRQSS